MILNCVEIQAKALSIIRTTVTRLLNIILRKLLSTVLQYLNDQSHYTPQNRGVTVQKQELLMTCEVNTYVDCRPEVWPSCQQAGSLL